VSDGREGFTRTIRKTIRERVAGLDLASEIDAVIAVNSGGSHGSAEAHAAQDAPIRQTAGRRTKERSSDG
jgi:hypothetical protein